MPKRKRHIKRTRDKTVFIIKKHESILAGLRRQEADFSAVCDGSGRCGKCKVRLIEAPPVTDSEHKLLSPKEISEGIRLACQQPLSSLAREVELVDGGAYKILGLSESHFTAEIQQKGIGVAVDIGTTTVAMAYVSLEKGTVLYQQSFINPQQLYGADVLSRISAAAKTGIEPMSRLIRAAICAHLTEFTEMAKQQIDLMAVCGNTTMVHLFMQEEVSGIGSYPFDYPIKEFKRMPAKSLELSGDFPVVILPPLSAYIGADTLSGINYLRLGEKTGNYLFIDLGTNGEIVYAKDDRLFAASAAAGPAFEGGNMKDGCGAVAGAVTGIKNDTIKTIAEQEPLGICGSGYISLIAHFLRKGLINPSGYLASGTIRITEKLALYQEDIRNFQLAKAAVRCGIDLLLNSQKADSEELTEVYLAGGFSAGIEIADFIELGIFPESITEKVRLVGNAALAGTVMFLLQDAKLKAKQIKQKTQVLDLTVQSDFLALFSEHMSLRRQ